MSGGEGRSVDIEEGNPTHSFFAVKDWVVDVASRRRFRNTIQNVFLTKISKNKATLIEFLDDSEFAVPKFSNCVRASDQRLAYVGYATSLPITLKKI